MKNILLILLFLLLIVSRFFAATRTSAQSGDWSSASTWDCNCIPATTDDAVILATHTVTLGASATINNLTINNNGTLSHGTSNRVMTITGNYILNGAEIGGNAIAKTVLSGVSKNISGLGSNSVTGGIEITTGAKSIIAGSNLIFSTTVNIIGNIVVSNSGEVTISTDLAGSAAGSTWTNLANSTLNIGGILLATGTLNVSSSGNTVSYYSSSAQNIKNASASEYYNLTLSGAATKTLVSNIIILGNLVISSATFDVSATNYSVSLAGNWENGGTFTEQAGTVTFNGSGNQEIINSLGETFYNYTLNKSAGTLTLSNDIVITNTLTFTAGTIDASTGQITLGVSAAAVGSLSYSSGLVIGNFRRWIDTSPTTWLFPVGVSGIYRPVLIDFNTAVTGCLSVSFESSSPGNAGLPLKDGADSIHNVFVDGYWNLTVVSGLASTDYNIQADGNGFSAFTINSSTRLLKRPDAASNWVLSGTHVSASGSVAKRNNAIGMPCQFAFGDTTNCEAPVTSLITGSDSVCINTTGEVYSVTNTFGSTYSWAISGGSITSGQGTNSITVTWGAAGIEGSLEVVENNGCSNGTTVTKAINVHSLPVSSISGKAIVAENTTSEVYSVTSSAGYSYTWTISGGTLVSGQGTSSITVDWGAAGTGQVQVAPISGCGTGATESLAIEIYYIINSIATGSWASSSTWDCSCVPTTTSNVRIASPHNVTLNAATTILNFSIAAGGTLSDNNKIMTVTGDIDIDGTYTGNNNLILSGTNTTIDGTGTISNAGTLSLTGGSKIISSGASLTRSPGSIAIANNISVTNNGTINIASDLTGGNSSSQWINSNNSSLNIGGVLLSTGTLSATSTGNTVKYNGTTQTIKSATYYNLSISDGSGVKTLAAATTVNGNLVIGTGNTLDVSASNFPITLLGNWTNSGTFTYGTGTVSFSGVSQSITKSGGETFYNVSVTGTSGTKSLGSNLTINGNLSINTNNTLDVSSSNYLITILGNWSNNGTFTPRNSTVSFNGTTQSITKSTGETFYNLTLAGASGTKTLGGNVTISGNLTINASNTLDASTSNYDVVLAGNWTNSGIFTARSATVYLNGTTQSITNTTGETFNNLTLSGASGTKTLGGPVTCNGILTIDANNTLDVSSSNYALTVAGNWVNNGTFTSRSGLVTLNGVANQSISGTNTFYDLTISNAAGATLAASSSHNLTNILTLSSNAVLTTTGASLTFLSTTSRTAKLAALSGTAGISGNIIMQRFVPGGATNWGFLSAPVSTTIADWTDDFPTSGFTGATGPAAGFVSIYTYDETVTGVSDNGYNPATNVTNTITPGSGFWVYLGDGTTTTSDINIDVSGAPYQGNKNYGVTFTSSGGAAEDGWNLVANPYPCEIDWKAPVGWTKTNINTTIYMYNADAGNYATYNSFNDASINGGSRYISSSQAFYVQTNAAAPSLVSTENVKVTTQNPAFLKMSNISNVALKSLKFKATANGFQDETILTLNADAAWGFDSQYDSYKLFGAAPAAPSLSTITNGEDYTINNIPELNSGIEVPMRLTIEQASQVVLSWSGLENFSSTGCFILVDLNSGVSFNLKDSTSYSFSLSDTTQAPRFLIKYSNSGEVKIIADACAGSNNGVITLGNTGSNHSYIIKDFSGNTIAAQSNLMVADTLDNVPAGNYIAYIDDQNGLCGLAIDTFSIALQNAVVANFLSDRDTTYISEGAIVFLNNLSSGSFTYLWDFGDNATSTEENPYHVYSLEGSYTITLTAGTGNCASSYSKSIVVLSDPLYALMPDIGAINVFSNAGNLILKAASDYRNVSLSLIDMTGRIVQSIKVNVNKGETVISCNKLSNGIYFVRFESDGNSAQKKVYFSGKE